MDKKPDYEGFGMHVREWDSLGIPYGTSDLVKLAEEYGTPIPGTKERDGEFRQ